MLEIARFSIVPFTAALLLACGASNQERDAQIAELAAAKGRLESDLATTRDRAQRERAARIDAQVKLARKSYELDLEKVNALVASTICDAKSGAISREAANERIDRAQAEVKRISEGCTPNEPGDKCVERKARAEAEGSNP